MRRLIGTVRWTIAAAAAIALMFAAVPNIEADKQIEGTPTEVERQADGWVKTIAKEPGFESWKNATFAVMPLGPGTHGWLVIVGDAAGYLIVQAAKDGSYRLGEYGLGRPPFDDSMRKLALMRLELIPSSSLQEEQIYIHPLLAVWHFKDGESAYADAMSGEPLPLTDKLMEGAASEAELWNGIVEGLAGHASGQITRSAANPTFNPYAKLPWLMGAGPLASSSIPDALDLQEQLRFTADRYDDAMMYAWAVTGYHDWDGMPYVALEAEEAEGSIRYVPLPLLEQLGRFYL